MKNKYFVTGATGCIGGWVVKNLIESGKEVSVLSRSGGLDKLRLIMAEDDLAKVSVLKADLLDFEAIRKWIDSQGVAKIIHLAAMQLPFCKADPRLGARVNVEGTVNIFEAAKAGGITSLVYSSSTAVYGKSEEYSESVLMHDTELIPHSHYGVYKVANEWSAKVYYESDGISSVGIRPYVVYGPLRDQGMTSTPTTAMKAVLKGEKYHISYGGRFDFQYVDDTAKAFIRAADAAFEGAETYNLGGGSVTMDEVISAIDKASPGASDLLTSTDSQLPFPPAADNAPLEELIGPICATDLETGVRKSMEIFKTAVEVA